MCPWCKNRALHGFCHTSGLGNCLQAVQGSRRNGPVYRALRRIFTTTRTQHITVLHRDRL